jgi:hypothetical protein
MRKRKYHSGLMLLVAAAVLICGCHGSGQTQSTVPSAQQNEDAPGFKEFMDRVNDYAKLHKRVESGLPAGKPTDLPELIAARQMAFARMIREARPDAKAGDIFTPAARKSFQHLIRAVMQSPQGTNAEASMNQGAPLGQNDLQINQQYPDKLPYTTVPPTLLAALPKLPDEVVYRIVGHDLVLLDLKANLVVDVSPGIIP